MRVYPRVCGGTLRTNRDVSREGGLSPRVRGNRDRLEHRPRLGGSIPACAGEPYPAFRITRDAAVYPRVCGGTRRMASYVSGNSGLSPRVRGNPRDPGGQAAEGGSIPACAGEPSRSPTPGRSGWVYPRVCGGTGACEPWGRIAYGLSPRVRGNREDVTRFVMRRGSIPACAGEPPKDMVCLVTSGVYPRVCGGTFSIPLPSQTLRGLSPRVRGNQYRRARCPYSSGSIPACAGEPACVPGVGARSRVYPRVCGGTHPESDLEAG